MDIYLHNKEKLLLYSMVYRDQIIENIFAKNRTAIQGAIS